MTFGVGIVVGLTGMGGGALMAAALILLGIPAERGVANDLVTAVVDKSVGAAVCWRQGSSHLRLALLLTVASVPFAFAGAFVVEAVGVRARRTSSRWRSGWPCETPTAPPQAS